MIATGKIGFTESGPVKEDGVIRILHQEFLIKEEKLLNVPLFPKAIIKKNLPISLVILDVNMPKLSGFDVALRLKGDKELKAIPIILLTALSQDVNIERGYNLGVEDYLTKPFSVDHLFLKVRKYLS